MVCFAFAFYHMYVLMCFGYYTILLLLLLFCISCYIFFTVIFPFHVYLDLLYSFNSETNSLSLQDSDKICIHLTLLISLLMSSTEYIYYSTRNSGIKIISMNLIYDFHVHKDNFKLIKQTINIE